MKKNTFFKLFVLILFLFGYISNLFCQFCRISEPFCQAIQQEDMVGTFLLLLYPQNTTRLTLRADSSFNEKISDYSYPYIRESEGRWSLDNSDSCHNKIKLIYYMGRTRKAHSGNVHPLFVEERFVQTDFLPPYHMNPYCNTSHPKEIIYRISSMNTFDQKGPDFFRRIQEDEPSPCSFTSEDPKDIQIQDMKGFYTHKVDTIQSSYTLHLFDSIYFFNIAYPSTREIGLFYSHGGWHISNDTLFLQSRKPTNSEIGRFYFNFLARDEHTILFLIKDSNTLEWVFNRDCYTKMTKDEYNEFIFENVVINDLWRQIEGVTGKETKIRYTGNRKDVLTKVKHHGKWKSRMNKSQRKRHEAYKKRSKETEKTIHDQTKQMLENKN